VLDSIFDQHSLIIDNLDATSTSHHIYTIVKPHYIMANNSAPPPLSQHDIHQARMKAFDHEERSIFSDFSEQTDVLPAEAFEWLDCHN
jgi:hypothetical protein